MGWDTARIWKKIWQEILQTETLLLSSGVGLCSGSSGLYLGSGDSGSGNRRGNSYRVGVSLFRSVSFGSSPPRNTILCTSSLQRAGSLPAVRPAFAKSENSIGV